MSIKIYIPGLPVKSYEYRRGDAQIIHDDKKNAIVIDGGEPDLSGKLIAYCRNNGINHITYILTHWHEDHDAGMKAFLDASGIFVDKIYCPPPAEVKTLTADDGVSEYNRATRRITLAKSYSKPIVYPAAGKVIEIKVGDVRCRLWRRAANRGDYANYQVNNTSICCYFPDLYYATCGDLIGTYFYKTKPGTIKVFKIDHHGNACTSEKCNLLKEAGAALCWYNDWEKSGTAVGGSGFSKYGAGYCKKYFTTLRTDSDIIMTAANKVLTVQKGSSSWSFAIPYTGEVKEGWVKGTKGWWYQYKDGTYAVGWKELDWSGGRDWFYFNENGWMITGWLLNQSKGWYYLDPKTGAMVKNKKVCSDESYYFLDGDGVMRIGWYDEPGVGLHYLEPIAGRDQGHMYVNRTADIDGKHWTFDADGIAKETALPIIPNNGFKGYNVTKRTEKIQYIVIHYTGSEGTAAENVQYFNKADRQASADFFIGHAGEICQYNPDIKAQYSWHCGGGKQSSKGGTFYGKCTNKNSIGIELCTKKSGNKWTFSVLTLDAAVSLVAWLMAEYSIPLDHVIRHYDVTGKNCPGVTGWTSPDTEWIAWKSRLTSDVPALPYRVRKSWADAQSQIGAFNSLENAKAMAAAHPGYHVFDANGTEII